MWRRVFGAGPGRHTPSDVAPLRFRSDLSAVDLVPEEVYHDAAQSFPAAQTRSFDQLDNKVTQTFSAGILVLPITGALLNLSQVTLPDWAIRALIAAILAFAFLIGLVILANRSRQLEYRPSINTLGGYVDEYAAKPLGGRALKRWVGDEYRASIDRNAQTLSTKAKWVGWAQTALSIEALCLAAAVVLIVLL